MLETFKIFVGLFCCVMLLELFVPLSQQILFMIRVSDQLKFV